VDDFARVRRPGVPSNPAWSAQLLRGRGQGGRSAAGDGRAPVDHPDLGRPSPWPDATVTIPEGPRGG
jgi:hypothetical protein